MHLRKVRVIRATLLVIVLGYSEVATGQSRLFVTNNLTNNNPGGRLLEFDGATGQFVNLVANMSTPRGIKVGPDGDLYVASAIGHSVLKFSIANGLQQSTFIAPGSGGLSFPEGLAFGPDGNLYVTSGSSSTNILRYNGQTGSFMGVFATYAPDLASDLVFGPDGDLFVAMYSNGVYQFNGQTGAPLGNFVPATNFTFVGGIAFGPDDNLYISTESADSVLRYNGTTGAFIDTFVSAGSGGLNGANGIEFGPDGNLYVAGGFSDAILRYNGQSGAFLDVFATGPIDAPQYFTFVVPEPGCLTLLAMLCAITMFGRTRLILHLHR
jgi:WD40 repeat protein